MSGPKRVVLEELLARVRKNRSLPRESSVVTRMPTPPPAETIDVEVDLSSEPPPTPTHRTERVAEPPPPPPMRVAPPVPTPRPAPMPAPVAVPVPVPAPSRPSGDFDLEGPTRVGAPPDPSGRPSSKPTEPPGARPASRPRLVPVPTPSPAAEPRTAEPAPQKLRPAAPEPIAVLPPSRSPADSERAIAHTGDAPKHAPGTLGALLDAALRLGE